MHREMWKLVLLKNTFELLLLIVLVDLTKERPSHVPQEPLQAHLPYRKWYLQL